MVVQSVHKHQGNKRCIVLHLNALKTPHCEWIRGCSDMSDLRYFLAKYLQQLYGHRISQVGGVKIPQFDSQEKLSSDDIGAVAFGGHLADVDNHRLQRRRMRRVPITHEETCVLI